MSAIKSQLRRLGCRAQFYMDVPGLLQLLKFKDLRSRYYHEFWQAAAQQIGAHYQPWRGEYVKISRAGLTVVVRQGELRLDDHLALDIMGHKGMVYDLMRGKGLRVPAHVQCSVNDVAARVAFFETRKGPVVVKPASGTGGGRGVTTGITDLSMLHRAARLAARFDPSLIVEEQVQGSSFRLLYLDGQFVDAIRRDPPVVTGDGKSSLRQLVQRENKRRLAGAPVTALSPLKIDRDCLNYLRGQGLKPSFRPAQGAVVQLKRAVNENANDRNHNVRDTVHHQTIEEGARLVQDFGIKLAGIDVLCQDITAPLSLENGLISEINTTPGLHHHDLISCASQQVPVAEIILEHLLQTGQGVMRLDMASGVHSEIPTKTFGQARPLRVAAVA